MTQTIYPLINEERIVVVKRTLEFSREFYNPIALGEPLTPELRRLVPTTIYIEDPQKGPLLDIFEASGVWIVNSLVRSIIEALEPEVHSFMGVPTIKGESGAKWHGYSLLYIGQSIDAVLIDESAFRDGDGRAGFSIAPVLNALRGFTVLDGSKIYGRHLWRGGDALLGRVPDPFWGYTFCSDDLAERIKSSGAEGWEFRPCKVLSGQTD